MNQDDFDTTMDIVFELLKGHTGIQVVTSCVTDLFFVPPELDDLGTTTNSSPQQPWDFILMPGASQSAKDTSASLQRYLRSS